MLKTLLENFRLKYHKWVSLVRGNAIVYITETVVSKKYGELSGVSCSSNTRSIYRCTLKDYWMLKNANSTEWYQTVNEYDIVYKNGVTYIYIELKGVDMNIFA